jgi:hypothetical protein
MQAASILEMGSMLQSHAVQDMTLVWVLLCAGVGGAAWGRNAGGGGQLRVAGGLAWDDVWVMFWAHLGDVWVASLVLQQHGGISHAHEWSSQSPAVHTWQAAGGPHNGVHTCILSGW